MLNSLAGVLTTTQQDSVGSSRCTQSELIKGQALSTSLQDAGTSSLGEAQGADSHFGQSVQEAVIIGNGADKNGNLSLALVAHLTDDAADGHWRAINARHEQTLEDNFVEGCLRTTRQKAIQLDEQSHVDILTLGRLPILVLDVLVPDIDTLDTHELPQTTENRTIAQNFEIEGSWTRPTRKRLHRLG